MNRQKWLGEFNGWAKCVKWVEIAACVDQLFVMFWLESSLVLCFPFLFFGGMYRSDLVISFYFKSTCNISLALPFGKRWK
jgi:hypothetical protein